MSARATQHCDVSNILSASYTFNGVALEPGFSISFSWRDLKNLKNLLRNPDHKKSDTKLDMSIGLSFMYIACQQSTVNLRLLENLMPSPDTSTVWPAMPIGWTAAAIDCLRATSGGMISVECRHTNFNSRLQI